MTTYSREQTLLQVKDISLSFETNPILSDIHFNISDITRPGMQQGQVVSLIGRSGIGKTQLFRILSGLQKPDTGAILINDGTVFRPVHAGDMGVIFQNYYQFGWRTVYQSLKLAARQNSILKGKEDEAVLEYAAQFELTPVLQSYPKQLSGGQQQRVSIIQQLLKGSNFLLLDEPFSGLDVCVLDKVVNLLLKVSVSHEWKTLIIVSHDIQTTVAISDTVFILGKKPGLPGSTIVKEIDLMERGLAWEKDIREKKEFSDTIREIKSYL